ncbi:type III restriction protein res subunit [Azoarcus sp. CIB]|nr:type III restriction protein res subunit [Azoarcus sp. CIB]
MFAPREQVEASSDCAFAFHPDIYPAKWYCRGGYRFSKHYYPVAGELKSDGDEFLCARALDWLPA